MGKKLLHIFAKSAGIKQPTNLTKIYEKNYPANKGYRPDVDIEFKSSMEANVYRFYVYVKNKHGKIKQVEYEPEIFYFKPNTFGIRAYVPDIKINTGKNSYFVEVKGKMDNTSRKKAWLLSKNYPWIRLYLIGPKQYSLIKKYYSKFIPFWE